MRFDVKLTMIIMEWVLPMSPAYMYVFILFKVQFKIQILNLPIPRFIIDSLNPSLSKQQLLNIEFLHLLVRHHSFLIQQDLFFLVLDYHFLSTNQDMIVFYDFHYQNPSHE